MSEDTLKSLEDVLALVKESLFDVKNGDPSFARINLEEAERKLKKVLGSRK